MEVDSNTTHTEALHMKPGAVSPIDLFCPPTPPSPRESTDGLKHQGIIELFNQEEDVEHSPDLFAGGRAAGAVAPLAARRLIRAPKQDYC